MKLGNLGKLFAASLFALTLSGFTAQAEMEHIAPQEPVDPKFAAYANGDARSGYIYATDETRAMQDDDFENPGFLWVEIAQREWDKVEGEAGKSCASCHSDVESMKGVGARYPVVDEKNDKLVNVEKRINQCRTENMKADAWKWESDQLLGMTALVKMQSRGMPMDVKIDGPAAKFYKQGEDFFFTRRGQMDLACKHCHVDQNNNWVRAEYLSQGQANGFPTYRLKWSKLGSLHRRFRGCNNNIRATKLDNGSPEYMALELYLSWRSNGLPVESPSVRK